MFSSSQSDALIVGAGPAGSTLAIALARAGREIVLIERSKGPEHKVCGEFLSPAGLRFLRKAGIHPEALGAQTIHSVRIATKEVIAEAELPEKALSLTRRTLDEALLRRAKDAGVTVLRGYTVNRLTQIPDNQTSMRWHAQMASGSAPLSILGRDAFLATGKHDVHGWSRAKEGTHHTLVALKMYVLLVPEQHVALEGHIELVFYPGGYAGLQPVEGDWVNLTALISQAVFRSLGGCWSGLLEHMFRHSRHLERRLCGSRELLDRPLAISSIPYGYCVRAGSHAESPWRLGDQATVIPSFCGDGMSIALHTADRAAQFYLGGKTSSAFHAEIREGFQKKLHWASVFSRLLVAAPALVEVARVCPALVPMLSNAIRLAGGRDSDIRRPGDGWAIGTIE